MSLLPVLSYPEITYINQGHTAMNTCSALPQVLWEQWWFIDHAIFPKSSEMAGSNVYAPEESHFNNDSSNYYYTYKPEYSTQ